MTKLIVTDVDEVIRVTKDLITNYMDMGERFREEGQEDMMISANGSVVGLVRLLSMITDKGTTDWFTELEIWD